MPDYRVKAKRLMAHYITLVMNASGLNVDGDTYAELNDVVDNIIEAAKEGMRQALDARPQCQWFHYSKGTFNMAEAAGVHAVDDEVLVYMRSGWQVSLKADDAEAFKAAWAEYQAA